MVIVLAAFLLAVFAQATHWHERDVANHGGGDSQCTLCLHLSHLGDTSASFVFVRPPFASEAGHTSFTVSVPSIEISHAWFARGPPSV